MDKSMLGDLDALPEEDKLRMSSMIDQLQIRDRCAEKFLKHSMRVGMRFAELNQGAATPD